MCGVFIRQLFDNTISQKRIGFIFLFKFLLEKLLQLDIYQYAI